MAQQTAVEWIAEKMEKLIPPGNQMVIYIMLEQAKQMEEEQKYETSAFWFGRGILAEKENRIEELKPNK